MGTCLECDLEMLGPLVLLAALLAPIAVALHIRKARRNDQPVRRKRVAFIVTEIVLLVVGGYGSAMAYMGTKIMAERGACQANMRVLSYAMIEYLQDHGEKFPPADSWADAITPYLEKADAGPASGERVDLAHVFECPAGHSRYGYGFNKALGGRTLASVEDIDDTIMIYDAEADIKNFSGGRESLAPPRRHVGWLTLATVSGAVEQLNPYASRWRWLDGKDADPAQRGPRKE